MSDHRTESLHMMLGEMRADLKYLVAERQRTSERLDTMEAAHNTLHEHHDHRLTRLEHFKTKVGVLTTGLGIGVPTALTVMANKMGLLG